MPASIISPAKTPSLKLLTKSLHCTKKSVPGGTTYSCNIISGGSVLNVIPDSCSVSLDIRACTNKDMIQAKAEVETVAQTEFIPGTSCQVTMLSCRPPMEKRPETLALLVKLQQVCQKYDLGTLTPMESGGGSDSCYTQAAGIASICGFGASGGLQHTPKEFLNKDSIPLRAKILAGFLYEDT